VRALLGPDEDSDGDSGGRAGARAKRERGGGGGGGGGGGAAARVKREPGSGGGARCAGGGSVFLDLTRAPDAPLVVGGRTVGTGEVAVCDLLDSDGEEAGAPRWEVRKKQAVEVDATDGGGA
jgi:hypothetical protein